MQPSNKLLELAIDCASPRSILIVDYLSIGTHFARWDVGFFVCVVCLHSFIFHLFVQCFSFYFPSVQFFPIANSAFDRFYVFLFPTPVCCCSLFACCAVALLFLSSSLCKFPIPFSDALSTASYGVFRINYSKHNVLLKLSVFFSFVFVHCNRSITAWNIAWK